MKINSVHFYRGTPKIDINGTEPYQKNRVVKHEFNTTDANGNKVMDKMSEAETLQAMKTISKRYGENVIVEFSGDAMAALLESRKNLELQTSEKQAEIITKQVAFESDIVHLDRSVHDLPEYSGIYDVDKAIATAIESNSKEEQGFVYDIIRQNFLISDSQSMTAEERQANISLGMKKAEYAAENFIPEGHKDAFLDAMETIAKLATAGQQNEDHHMTYDVQKASYLGHGSNLVHTTDSLDMMKQIDSSAYAKYEELLNDETDGNNAFNALKHLTNWYVNAVRENSNLVEQYESKTKERMSNTVNDQQIDHTFKDIKTDSKYSFIEGLKSFQTNNPDFLSLLLNKEISSPFWKGF